jgi:HNH endonuclease
MSVRVAGELRRTVFERAAGCCEYCRIHQSLVASAHQVDHVIAEKHGGPTTLENLALSCMTCNLRKASDVASFDPDAGNLVPLFNPRTQTWSEHFTLVGPRLAGLSAVGRTTVEFLQLNSYERVMERAELIEAGVYPAPAI